MASDAAASHPMKPAPMTTADLASAAASRSSTGVGQRAQQKRPLAAGHRQWRRPGTAGKDQRAVGNSLAVDGHGVRRRRRSSVDGLAVAKVDVALDEPLRRMQRDVVGVTAQEVLAQRRSLVRQVGVGAEHQDRSVAAVATIRLRGTDARWTTSDDDQSRLRSSWTHVPTRRRRTLTADDAAACSPPVVAAPAATGAFRAAARWWARRVLRSRSAPAWRMVRLPSSLPSRGDRP